ncbi:RNA-binding protein [Ruminiclostridium sufflavum DSM 19573]|uniref:RNA-binding protein n=1 Tax=Ruminiclostridium sufflavum DSM 19573 TaxID=1121337 RepID=A0A318Y0J3_9FIRM|nr:ribosome assembly RNA-binding protein YhbY [Ruminiclostridium sufflavum]PYG88824.1 RNA-binding protein [Ruminiclostridium sufflavum DSM 19573]
MLTGKQRSYLRALANNIQPIFQIGKGGINDNMLKQFSDALEARELIKATVLKNAECDAKLVCEEIAELTQSQIVQVIGSKFVLYRQSEKNAVIELPR